MNRISESLRILLWSCVFIYVVICSLQITQVDVWWQLSEGFHILQTFHLPTQPVTAYGLPANPYFDEYAGYEVVLACFYKAFGFGGLWLLFIGIFLTIIFLPSFYSRKTLPAFDIFSCLSLLLIGVFMKARLSQRPELVGILLQVLVMLRLREWKLETVTLRSSLPFFFIFLVWTNTHSSFVIGGFTVCLWIACEFILKSRTIFVGLMLKNALILGVVGLIAVSLNPYGLERLCFPFWQALDPGATALSPEMWPIEKDQKVLRFMMWVSIFLFLRVFLSSRSTSLWLILFSAFSIYMTFQSSRWCSFLALALLFVYAARDAQMKSPNWRSPFLGVLRVAGLSLLCLFMLFGDAFSFNLALNEMRGEKRFVTPMARFFELPEAGLNVSGAPIPVLCGDGEGSYLSFDGNRGFRPLIDTGLAHFSNETKRYFFMIWHEPKALGLAIHSLDVDHVVVNRDNLQWILFLRACPGWKVTACTSHGMLWERTSGAIYVSDPADAAKIAKSRDSLLNGDQIYGAFCYSTLIDSPRESLVILTQFDREWSDPLFNYFNLWLDTVPRSTIQEFVSSKQARDNLLLTAILAQRLGPPAYDEFFKTIPQGPKPVLWEILSVRNEIARGNVKQARSILDAISTNQPSSLTYYTLRKKLNEEDSNAKPGGMSAFGQWQTWDEDAAEFVRSYSLVLNNRIAYLNKIDSR
jgi:hypothetical protein